MLIPFSIRWRAVVVAILCSIGFATSAYASWLIKSAWEKEDCVDNHSFAWCFVHNMTGRPNDLFQYPDSELTTEQYEKFEEFTAHSELPYDLAVGAAAGVHYGIGAANGANAMVHTTLFKLNVVSSILNASNGVERFYPRIWLVMDKARPIDQQQQEFATAWQQSLQTVLKFEYTGEDIDYGDIKPTFGKPVKNIWRKVKAEGCDDSNLCIAQSEKSWFTDLRDGTVSQVNLPKVSWLGTGEMVRVEARDDLFPLGYWITSNECVQTLFHSKRNEDGDCKNSSKFHTFDRKYLMQLSKILPATVWIWSPIDRKNSNVIPAIINSGVAHYFIKKNRASETITTDNSKN